MTKSALMTATEVSEYLGTSKAHAYKVMRQLNEELKNQGYITIQGKVSRAYFEEKIYGAKEAT